MPKNRNRSNTQRVITETEENEIFAAQETAQETVATEAVESNTETVTTETPTPTSTSKFNPDELKKELGNKSKVIRYLASQGMKTAEIHKLLVAHNWRSDKNPDQLIRYQHVRNVLNQPLVGKAAPASPVQPTTTEESKVA